MHQMAGWEGSEARMGSQALQAQGHAMGQAATTKYSSAVVVVQAGSRGDMRGCSIDGKGAPRAAVPHASVQQHGSTQEADCLFGSLTWLWSNGSRTFSLE